MTEHEINRITPNDSADQSSSSDNVLPTASTNTEDTIQRQTSLGFEPRRGSILGDLFSSYVGFRRPSVLTLQMIRQEFADHYNDPISESDQRRFRQYFNSDISAKTFTVNEFCDLFHVGTTLGRRLLLVFNQNQAYETNSIPCSDVIRIARLLWNSPVSLKAFILFKLFDENNDDKISINEIRSFYENYLTEFKIFENQERWEEVVRRFLQGFFSTNNNIQLQELKYEEFYQILQQNPDVFKSLYLIGIPDQDKEDEKEISWYKRWWKYIKNNASRVAFLVLYILTLICLIIYRVITLEDQTVWQIIARVGGILLNFNFTIAISLMLKQMMTIIRRLYYLRLLIPVDDHIDAHRFIGTMSVVSTMVHTFGHVVHFAIHTDKHSWVESMFTTAAEVGWIGHSAPINGDILLVLLIIMFICSLQYIRQRSGFYKLFQYTHYLFWPISILLVIHAKDFWKWAIGPMSLLILEKVYLLKRYLSNHGRTRLIAIRIEDKKVLTLIIERPKHFRFRTGSYINICFPNIASMEWHPFTISSAPEQKDILRLNIRKEKNWTKKVYDHFYGRLKNLNNISDLTEIIVDNPNNHSNSNSRNISLPKTIIFSAEEQDAIVYIEGPFSTSTSYMFDCEHVVLIGAGIGITPFISALESLIYRLREHRYICSHCGGANYNERKLTCQKLKKVDFIWVNPEMGNFSWFRNILEEFEKEQESYLNATSSNTNNSQEQRSRYLDIHLYCTSILSNEQAMLRNLPYDLVANMYAVMQHEDMHTQLKTRTHVGRPPWKLLFAKFKAEHQSTNVFFTGKATMGDEIKRYCDEFGFPFQHEPYF